MPSAPPILATPLTQNKPAPHATRRARAILAALFLASLYLPLAGAWQHWDPSGASHENRRLAVIPPFPKTLKDAKFYSDRWLSFFRDHFGFRNTLIRAVAVARFHGLGADADGRVLVGKDGWLFIRPAGDENYLAFRGLNPFSESELDAWQLLLERRQAWLSARNIPFLVVIPPDKQTIYPEYLPDEVKILRPHSRLDQLIDRLRQTHSPVHLLDLRPALLAAKPSAILYQKSDTHWNDLGAYVAYRAILPAISRLLPKWNLIPQPRSNFVEKSDVASEGNLARMMDMIDQYPDRTSALIRKTPFPLPEDAVNPHSTGYTNTNDPNLPRLVFYHDSFAIALVPMLGPHFSHAFYSFNYEIDPAAIQREKPDLVINEFLEQNLYQPPPTDPPTLRK